MQECLFCKIIARDIPAAVVAEDEHSLAFLDINPTNRGHTLLVPKTHIDTIYDAPDHLLARLAPSLKKLAQAVKEAVEADGVTIIQNNGSAAGQLVLHLHFHIVPRFTGDGFRHWKGEPYQNGEMEEIALKITGAMVG